MDDFCLEEKLGEMVLQTTHTSCDLEARILKQGTMK